MPNIRFAQLSFWFGHAHGICNAAQKHDSVDLSAIWDADAKRGQAAADHFGVEFIPDLDELLARDDIDAVGIASETQLHGEHIIRAAEAGKHCMVEKPFTRTPEQADQAIAAAEQAGVQVMRLATLVRIPPQLRPTGIQRVLQILRRPGQRGGDADHDV